MEIIGATISVLFMFLFYGLIFALIIAVIRCLNRH